MSQSHEREAALFDAALDLSGPERAAFLDRECAGDDPLRHRIEALLKACATASAYVDSPPDAAALAPTQVQSAAFEKVGDRIGRYKLLQKIGEGGCGVVYVAEQEEPVRRRVALKIIKLGLDTRSVIARFEAERQALALMDHPNIARVLDGGATETGRPYFVMELVRGLKITEYCDEAKLPTEARLKLFIQVCGAIQHAHQKGIVHRDIKPSNILVTVDDGIPMPKVIDFGIAKATSGQRLTDKTIFTAFEQFIGTPAYMSPEQATLTSADIDTRSDIYALGVLLYELLTGRTPFDVKELAAAGLDEMRRTIREREPSRPSTRLSTLPGDELITTAQRRGIEPPKLVTALRGDLDWIVLKALEKDRARRYETANGFSADVQRYLNDEPVVARPPGRVYRLRKLIRRNRLVFAAGSAVAASLVLGLTLSTILFLRERAARLQASERMAVVKAVKDFLVEDLLDQADSLNQALDGFAPDPNLTVRQALQRAARRVGNRFHGRPREEAAIRMAIGSALGAVGEAEQGIEYLRRAVDLNHAESGPDHRDTLQAMQSLASAIAGTGRFEEALPMFEQTLALMKARFGPDDPDTLGVMNNIAWAYLEAGKPDQALPLYEENLKRRKATLAPGDPFLLGAMNNLGMGYHRAGRLNDAVQLFEQTLQLMREKLGPSHPFTWNVMLNLGTAFRDSGKPALALPLFRDVVQFRKTGLGPEDQSTLESLYTLAEALRMTDNDAEAEAAYREILGRLRPSRGPASPREIPLLGRTLHHLADLLRERKASTEARPLAEQAVAAYARHPSWPDHERAHAFAVLETVLEELGDTRELQAVRLKHVAALRAGAERGDVGALNGLAWILATCADATIRDGQAAIGYAQRAVDRTGGRDPALMDTLAAAYAESGDFAKAVEVQREAVGLCTNATKKGDFAKRLNLYAAKTPFRTR